ncbi:MAG: AAA family ATPase [Candidatus Aminicenantes bacterium]|nr:AAA family ATPase [Candidatus Aminicenantes bacterium]
MSDQNKPVKKIPYGISDYELIRGENYYYVDKTPYLETLEKTGRYVFFIRPRRFGKSLFVSLMVAYYDLYYKDRFEEFFKGTWIYDHPTGEQGQYLLLTFNFSAVDAVPDKIETSFLDHVRGTVLDFLDKYSDILSSGREHIIHEVLVKNIEESRSASDILSNLLRLCKRLPRKLYVIIDEYDNFANSILSSAGGDAYRNLTHGVGFFRSFFNVLKSGSTGTGAPIARTFITGVSPVTMDDVTSGYNIGKNLSLEPGLNRMLGFTEADVTEMIEYYREQGLVVHPTPDLLAVLTRWYGNYLFSPRDDLRMFNSDMVLYFIDNYIPAKAFPDDLIDRNVRIDYGKLRHLIMVDKGQAKKPAANGNFSNLKEIIEEGGTSSKIVSGFPLEGLLETKNFKSLLFYLGLLTIEGPDKNMLRLRIPNETIKRLYYDYIEAAYRETGVFALDLSKYSQLMTGMAYDGEWRSLFEFLTARMSESMSLRDLIVGEKSIQAFLNVYLGLSDLYIIHAEKEMNKGYADIVIEPFLARYEGIKYSYIIEIKYKKRGDRGRKDSQSSSLPLPGTSTGDAFDVLFKKEILKEPAAGEAGPDSRPGADGIDKKKVQQLVEEAEEQLKKYSIDKKFRKSIGKTELVKLVLVFSGHEAVYIGPVK